MSTTASSASSPVTVSITPGQTPASPPSITQISFNGTTGALVFTFSDGTQQNVLGFAAAVAASLGGASLAVLDTNGALLLGGKPRFGVDADGALTCPTPLPDTTNGFVPVAGSTVIYLNGSGPMEVA
ncbi:hypothetical protein [Brytella acorum]|uniref:Uncharacterized protein n=1 Tax=Brytella acorum TaxID=2959299 RepID=A0AA35Y338_9PROT|nr:hypothetical protein [Brytella acorum]CAI9120450.1 hypothetical protein LMG32879_001283 [Brytella acorum]